VVRVAFKATRPISADRVCNHDGPLWTRGVSPPFVNRRRPRHNCHRCTRRGPGHPWLPTHGSGRHPLGVAARL